MPGFLISMTAIISWAPRTLLVDLCEETMSGTPPWVAISFFHSPLLYQDRGSWAILPYEMCQGHDDLVLAKNAGLPIGSAEAFRKYPS